VELFRLIWWRDVLARAVRNALQVVLPVLALASTTGTIAGVDWRATLDLVASAAVVSLVKAMLGMTADDTAPVACRALERAVPAAAAVLLGFVTAPAWSMFCADWAGIGVATLSAALAAVVHMVIDPPAAHARYGLAPRTSSQD
jgi:hypothetical protein